MATEPVRGAIIAPVLALVCALLPLPAWMFETFYSRDTFPWLQSGFTTLSNLTSIAVIDVLIVGVVVVALIRVVRLALVLRDRGVLAAAWEAARRVVRMASVLIILFFFAWGFNYRRQPLESSFAGDPAPPSATSLVAGFDDANTLATRLRPTVQADRDLSFEAIASDLRDPMAAALKLLGRAPLSTPSRPKHSIFVQPFFVRAGVDGMLNPLALESILNEELLPFERPFVLAHEWAHLAGHADEAEASAVGWFACMQAGAASAYSASLYLIMQAQAAMPADVRQKALGRLSSGVREDLVAIAERLEREDATVQRAAARVYDGYLRANRVQDGNASYGRALQLILAPPLRDALRSYR